MEIKTIEQIKEEYAIEQERDSWEEFREYYIYWDRGILQDGIDQVATLYASQFQKQNELLRERIKEMEGGLRAVLEINKAHGFNGHLVNDRIESLINKSK